MERLTRAPLRRFFSAATGLRARLQILRLKGDPSKHLLRRHVAVGFSMAIVHSVPLTDDLMARAQSEGSENRRHGNPR